MRRTLTFRRWLYTQLEPSVWTKKGLSPFNRFIVLIIIAAVGVAVIESEPTLQKNNDNLFLACEMIFASIFLAEYVLRLWASAENPRYGPGLSGRIRYILSPGAMIDLLAMSTLFLMFTGNQTSLLRLFRLTRILSLAKLGRYSTALSAIAHAIVSRRYELLMSMMIALVMLLVSSTLLYIFEGDVQPAAFGSIPRAMWWSIETLTTVGYGDVVPQTPLGRILAGLTAITGIGLIAMPTGILAAAFSDALQRNERRAGRHREDDEAK